jgi:hypothetical protein
VCNEKCKHGLGSSIRCVARFCLSCMVPGRKRGSGLFSSAISLFSSGIEVGGVR